MDLGTPDTGNVAWEFGPRGPAETAPLSWVDLPLCLGSSGDRPRNGCCPRPPASKGEVVGLCRPGSLSQTVPLGKSLPFLGSGWEAGGIPASPAPHIPLKFEGQDSLSFSVHGCAM